MAEITLLLPESIDLDKIILKTQLEVTPGFHKDKLAYLIHLISDVGSRKFETFQSNGFVSLKMSILNKVARNAKLYYEYLENEKIVKVNNQYIPDVKSRSYKLMSPYNKDRFVEYVVTDNVTKRAIKKVWKYNKLSNEAGLEDYEHLTKWYNDNLTIDKKLSENFCGIYHKYRLAAQKEDQQTVVKKWFEKMEEGGYSGAENSYIEMIESKSWQKAFNYEEKQLKLEILNISNAEHSLKIDSTSFRLHGPLTRLKSELRNLLSYDGKQLVSLDLKNSQPFFSLVLLNKDFWRDRRTRDSGSDILSIFDFENIYDELKTPASSKSMAKARRLAKEIKIDKIDKIDNKLDSIIMIAIYINLTEKINTVGKYIEKVENGTLFDYMATVFNKDRKEIVSREEAKVMMFTTLFSSNQFRLQKEAEGKRLFITLFPLVENIFQIIKFKNKALLAILLQTIESHMFLKVITKRIANEKPGLPIFTVHDSIITLLGEEEYVKNIMVDELTKAVGRVPEIKIESYNNENFYSATSIYNNQKINCE